MLTKQAKTLNEHQIKVLANHLREGRNGRRNLAIFLLSIKAGLRAKEIASLTWKMLVDGYGELSTTISLTNDASKGTKSGRVIPMNAELRQALLDLLEKERKRKRFDIESDYVVRTERSATTSPQAIVNMFSSWYRRLGFVGCSSHSGRRTFITNAAKKISLVGGSLRDVQVLAGHSQLGTTQRYIEMDTEAQNKIVNMI